MVESPWCSPTCSVLFPIGIVFVILPLIWIVLSWVQIQFLKRHMKRLVEERAWDELHALHSPSSMKYGPWKGRASRLLEDKKMEIKSNSFQLGISLRFVLEELEPLYREKAEEAEWRLDEWGPATKSGFLGILSQVRNCGLNVDPMVAWGDLTVCRPPKIQIFTCWLTCWPMVHMPWARAKFVLAMDAKIAALSMYCSVKTRVQKQIGFCLGFGTID